MNSFQYKDMCSIKQSLGVTIMIHLQLEVGFWRSIQLHTLKIHPYTNIEIMFVIVYFSLKIYRLSYICFVQKVMVALKKKNIDSSCYCQRDVNIFSLFSFQHTDLCQYMDKHPGGLHPDNVKVGKDLFKLMSQHSMCAFFELPQLKQNVCVFVCV